MTAIAKAAGMAQRKTPRLAGAGRGNASATCTSVGGSSSVPPSRFETGMVADGAFEARLFGTLARPRNWARRCPYDVRELVEALCRCRQLLQLGMQRVVVRECRRA